MSTDYQTLSQWLKADPYALCLSSGYFGFYAHAGFAAAILEDGITPAWLSGSSAGALVASCFASGLSASDVRDQLFALQREHFWDPGFGFGLLKGKLFRERLKRILPIKKFEDCRIPLSISAYSVLQRRTVVFQKGNLIDAVVASCAVPFMFQPVWINRKPYLDGGILDRPGMQGVKPGTRVLYHHLNSTSWWRRPNGVGAGIPQRKNLITIKCEALPRVNPYQLELGVAAYNQAYQTAKNALRSTLKSITGGI